MAQSFIPGDTTIRAIKSGDPRKRLPDGLGLYLLLFVKGGAHGWRLSYSINGKRKLLSLGTYPGTGLALARIKAAEARVLVAKGIDPSMVRKGKKADDAKAKEFKRLVAAGEPVPGSFEQVARQWFALRRDDWSESYGTKVLARLVADVFPELGPRMVADIKPPELRAVVRKIQERGVVETAHRALESCSQIFRYAVAEGLAESDPTRDLKGMLKTAHVKNFPAITKPERFAELLRACDGYQGTHVVRAALRLAPMLMLRPGELRHAQWCEFDLDTATWLIPPERMKRRKQGKLYGAPHLVPLPSQAVAVLRDLEPLTGSGEWVFRGERHHHRPMSENTVNAALRAMGFPAEEVTGHGFRATARTLLDEKLNVPVAVIESQLAHEVPDALGTAYNRTEFLEQRRTMMQTWADYLDRLRRGGEVVPLRERERTG